MASEYDINLSNGNRLATLYPLEVNGPDNRSTPRQILVTKPEFTIIQISGGNVFKLAHDQTEYFPIGLQFEVVDSTGSPSNDGTYTVANLPVPGSGSPEAIGVWYDSSQNETNIRVAAGSPAGSPPIAIPNPAASGKIVINAFVLAGDLTYRFIPGFVFDVQLSGTPAGSPPGSPLTSNDGQYTVDAFGSWVADSKTIIPPTVTIPVEGLPLGQVQYTVPTTVGSPQELHASLKLPGKGTLNYGEFLIEDLVWITENFAADVSPDLNANLGTNPAATPLVGQWWYRTLATQEGFLHWDGTAWTANYDINEGALILSDLEHPLGISSPQLYADIYFTASETNLPGSPWPGTPRPGAVVWTTHNPPGVGSPIVYDPVFRVLAAEGTELLVVETADVLSNQGDAFTRTFNNLQVQGRDGIFVDPPSGYDATITLDALTGQTAAINFETQSVRRNTLFVDDTESGINHPLHVQNTVGGGIQFDSPVGINNTPPAGGSPPGGSPADVWLEVTGNIQVNSQIRGSDQSDVAPTYSFTNHLSDGIYYDLANSATAFTTAGNQVLRLESAQLVASEIIRGVDGSVAGPMYSFTNAPTTGMLFAASGSPLVGDLLFNVVGGTTLTLSTTQVVAIEGTASVPSYTFAGTSGTTDLGMFADTNRTRVGISTDGIERLRVEFNGTISVDPSGSAGSPLGGYENLVTNDNDVPNKKYTDDAITTALTTISWREPVRVADRVSTTLPPGSPANVVDGVPIAIGERVLFAALNGSPNLRDIYVWDGISWFRDPLNLATVGDNVAVETGSWAGSIFIFTEDDEWITSGGVGTGYDEITLTGSPISNVITLTNVRARPKTSTKSFQQVFKNGILQRESAVGSPIDGNYYVSSATTITFDPAVTLNANDQIVVYAL